MLKVIGVLSLLLILVSGFSYTQHLNLKAKDVEISTQLESIDSLSKEVKDKKDRLEILANMNNIIVTDTRISDNSFNSLTDKLNQIDCTSQKEAKSDESNKTNITNSNVSKYYDVLHSAYRLQNEN